MDDTDPVLTRHKLNVDDYHRMAEAGILGEDDRVELIDGELIDMAPIGQDHIATVNGLAHALFLACGDRAIVSVQNPARLDRFSEPSRMSRCSGRALTTTGPARGLDPPMCCCWSRWRTARRGTTAP
jgi:hypothetical protein